MTAVRTGPGQSSWYRDVSGYQWLVLLLASAGWVFDVYEGQIFNLTRGQLLAEILPPGAPDSAVRFYGDFFLGVFLVGGALGGVVIGETTRRRWDLSRAERLLNHRAGICSTVYLLEPRRGGGQ
jgi:hypothetical protein